MQLKRLMALVMSIALALASSSFRPSLPRWQPAAPSQQAIQATGLTISGTVVQSDRKTPVADACLRLRKVDTNAIVARTVSDRNGAFSFSVSEPGMYLVEAVDCDDDGVLAVSDALTLAQLPLTTLVVLPATAVAAFLSSTAFLVLAAASAAGITAIAVQAGEDHPSAYRARSNSARDSRASPLVADGGERSVLNSEADEREAWLSLHGCADDSSAGG